MGDLLEVKVSNFEGPLDLLLHLIYKNELDIYDIPIAVIADQFVEEIKKMENVDMEVAADFIQMASYLIYLKSKMLLPRQFAIEEGVDPEEEKFIFTQRLVEYSFYKDMAMLFKEKEFFAQRYLSRGAILSLPVSFMPEDPYRLASSFFNIFEKHREDITTVVKDTVDIEEIVTYLSTLIEQEKELLWDRLKKLASSRREVVVFFLAVLELVKQKIVTVMQSQNFDNFVVIHNG